MIPYELHAGWTAVRRRGCCICSATSTSLTIGCTGRRRPGCRIRTRFGSQQRTDSGSTRLKSSRKVRSRVRSSASQASRILRSQRLYGHAREFREIGLTTLMPDLRGHGDSDGDRICLAYNETADIKAVTEYVKATYTDIPVIVMGCRWEEVSRSAQLERTMTSTHSSPCRHLLEFVRNVVDK